MLRVGGFDTPYPPSKAEDGYLPDLDRVLDKCYSDNACWPTNADWAKLNQTVSGALQLAIPPGAVCYKNFENGTSVYDAAKCADTQANWGNEQWLYDQPSQGIQRSILT